MRFRMPFLILAAITLLYAPILNTCFLFDDTVVVAQNIKLKAVSNFFWDVFGFHFKDSRPVSDFLLAFGQYLGGGAPYGQRVLSVLIHSLNCLLVLGILQHKARIGYFIAFLFAIHPIHTETIVVAQYRMDMLGSLFTLLSLYAAMKLAKTPNANKRNFQTWIFLALSMGLSALSKEVFLLSNFLVLLLVFSYLKCPFHYYKRLTAISFLMAVASIYLLQYDAQTAQPYSYLLGYANMTPKEHLVLSVRSLIEGIWQVLSGRGLSITRLFDRQSFSWGLSFECAILILFSTLVGLTLLAIRKTIISIAPLFAFCFIAVYLIIPNINIGSEHYWYLGSLGLLGAFLCVLEFFFLKFKLMKPSLLYGVFGLIGIHYFHQTYSRVKLMSKPEAFYGEELRRHPETASSWLNQAAVLLDSQDLGKLRKAKSFLDVAKTKDPLNPALWKNYFSLAYRTRDLGLATHAYAQLQSLENLESSNAAYRFALLELKRKP